MDKEILYVADPMCSWCWGFSPVIEAIRKDFGAQATVRLVVGGLRAGNTAVLSEARKQYSLEHWRRVHELSGQPFDFEFRTPAGFVYDTEPSCRAVVVVRNLKPESAFPYFKAVQHAFYVENEDVTNRRILADLAKPFEVEAEAFIEAFDSTAKQSETANDFQFAQRLGVSGFPSVVLNDQNGYKLLTSGYQSYEKLKPRLDAWTKE